MKSFNHQRHENLKARLKLPVCMQTCKAVEFGRFVTTGNDELDMIKTNITANIFKASHVLGEYSFI